MTDRTQAKVDIIHGPNLNMLGRREPSVYGNMDLEAIDSALERAAADAGIVIEIYQSNREGEIIERIHRIFEQQSSGLIINPAAFTHTSVAIRDAVLLLDIPVIEVHISNIYKRESFRRKSLLSDIVTGQITGLGPAGYTLALKAMAQMLSAP